MVMQRSERGHPFHLHLYNFMIILKALLFWQLHNVISLVRFSWDWNFFLSFSLTFISSVFSQFLALEKNPIPFKAEIKEIIPSLYDFPCLIFTNSASYIVLLLPHISYFQEKNRKRERRKRRERESFWKEGRLKKWHH